METTWQVDWYLTISLCISVILNLFLSCLLPILFFGKSLILCQVFYWVIWLLFLLWSVRVLHFFAYVFRFVVHNYRYHSPGGFSLYSWCAMEQIVVSLHHPVSLVFLFPFFWSHTWQATKSSFRKLVFFALFYEFCDLMSYIYIFNSCCFYMLCTISKLIISQMSLQFFQHHVLKKLFSPQELILTLLKNHLAIFAMFALCSAFLFCCYVSLFL